MAEWNRDTPWRQGQLLTSDAILALGLARENELKDTLVIVATHDCDIAQHPDTEPHVELVIGRLAAKDGNLHYAKNPRKLQLEFAGEQQFCGEFEATRKTYFPKQELIKYSPRLDVNLSTEGRATLQMWLASRYRRAAFPDEFERRLKDAKLDQKIAKSVKPHSEHIAGVFFDVDEGIELTRDGPNDTYTLDILILHNASPDLIAAEKAAMKAVDSIKKSFKELLFDPTKSWQQIELRICEPVSESVLTYEQFKLLKQWRLEHISLAADPQQELPPT